MGYEPHQTKKGITMTKRNIKDGATAEELQMLNAFVRFNNTIKHITDKMGYVTVEGFKSETQTPTPGTEVFQFLIDIYDKFYLWDALAEYVSEDVGAGGDSDSSEDHYAAPQMIQLLDNIEEEGWVVYD